MQWLHQSYKCMKAQQNKLSGCASNLLAHEDLGHFRKPVVGIYKPSSIMKNSHQYMKVKKHETLYHKDHGATLKHKCGKKDSSIVPFYFFFFFFWAFLFYLAFSFSFLFLGQCSMNDDHHTSIYLQLNDYNSILEQNMTVYECLRQCTGMCNESRVTCMKNYEWWPCINTMSTT